ncbi:DUF3303 domain-containing protein [Kineosporia sp. A_224]|uniref:DUF3303 domain-containing protein n=1 Tax=Kineosporia sp. A_224 TaxID=1962180 RepID=UPI000B4C1726|nr:DUF3303 family protein [Kineosporia sp. A_224]
MRFMVVEHYLHGAAPVYARLRTGGRAVPDGVTFVDSWVDESLDRCWQVMEAPDRESLDAWTRAWSDLVDFEITAVVPTDEAARRALG